MRFDVALLLVALQVLSLVTASPVPLHPQSHSGTADRIVLSKRREHDTLTGSAHHISLIIGRGNDDAESLGDASDSSRRTGHAVDVVEKRQVVAAAEAGAKGLSYGAKGLLAAVAGFGLAFAWGRTGDRQTLDNEFRKLTGRPVKDYNIRQMDELYRPNRWLPWSTYEPRPMTYFDPKPTK